VTSAWVGVWAAIAAGAVAVISALFAFLSLQVSRNALKMGAVTAGTTELLLKVGEFFAEQPKLRPYFYDGWSVSPDILSPQRSTEPRPLTDEDVLRCQLLSASEYFLDVLEAIWDNVRNLPKDDQESYREWMHDMLETGPVLRRFLEQFKLWYPTLTELIESSICSRQPEPHPYIAQSAAFKRRVEAPVPAPRPEPAPSADSDH
jgi:hypothetical protein